MPVCDRCMRITGNFFRFINYLTVVRYSYLKWFHWEWFKVKKNVDNVIFKNSFMYNIVTGIDNLNYSNTTGISSHIRER